MSAARIITTTEKFDEMGKLVERITKEEFPEKHTCQCEKQKESEKKKATEIRFPFLCPTPRELAMEIFVKCGRIWERPRTAEEWRYKCST